MVQVHFIFLLSLFSERNLWNLSVAIWSEYRHFLSDMVCFVSFNSSTLDFLSFWTSSTRLCCCTWRGHLLSTVLVQQIIVASQSPGAVVVCSEALEDFPVEGVVVFKRKSMEKLEERLWQDKVSRLFHLECGYGQNLVYPEKLWVLWRKI